MAEMTISLVRGVTTMILNASAARLGQAYKETSDVLQRDNLETSASVVNCVGGLNGRSLVAVLKSNLIDLELLAA